MINAANGSRVGFPRRSERGRRIVNRHPAGKTNAAVVEQLRDRRRRLELVADMAEELGKHVLQGDESGGTAEFVHDERLMRAPLAKLAKHAVGRDALVDAHDRPDQCGQRRLAPAVANQPADQILRVKDSDHVVDRIAVDRQSRVWAFRHGRDDLVHRRVDGERGDSPARHHELLGRPQVQPQRAQKALMLVWLEQAAVAALGDQQLDLLRRVNVPVRRLRDAEEPHHGEAGAVQPRDERPVDPHRRQHRHERVEGRLRRVLKGKGLGNQLADDHLADGQHEEHDAPPTWTRRRRR